MKDRKGMEPSGDCFFHEVQRCVGFAKCDGCDFHDLEPSKTAIVNRIKKELKEIKGVHTKITMLKGDVLANDRASKERAFAFEALDKFNGVQIMNGILNSKFGFRIPDVGSMTVQRMVKKFKKKGQQLRDEAFKKQSGDK